MTQAFAGLEPSSALERAGFRFGRGGTHSSRTMMLRELSELFETVPADATADDYGTAIVEENALGKRTWATRRSSRQRLNEMYGLDPRPPVSRTAALVGG